jgi:hypothetical protein
VAPSGENAGRQVFVGNLSYQASWQDLKDFFCDVCILLLLCVCVVLLCV